MCSNATPVSVAALFKAQWGRACLALKNHKRSMAEDPAPPVILPDWNSQQESLGTIPRPAETL